MEIKRLLLLAICVVLSACTALSSPTQSTVATPPSLPKPKAPAATVRVTPKLLPPANEYCFERGTDYPTFFSQYEALAAAGDAKAQFCLGLMYANSLATFRDEARSASLIIQAATNESQELDQAIYYAAKRDLAAFGGSLVMGSGTLDRNRGVVRLLEVVANNGYANVQFELADILDRICIQLRDCQSNGYARLYALNLTAAAKQGYMPAMSALAEWLADGKTLNPQIPFPKDKLKAFDYYCQMLQQQYLHLYTEFPSLAYQVNSSTASAGYGVSGADVHDRFTATRHALSRLYQTEHHAPWPSCQVWLEDPQGILPERFVPSAPPGTQLHGSGEIRQRAK